MRVVEPKTFKHSNSNKRSSFRSRRFMFVGMAIVLLTSGYFFLNLKRDKYSALLADNIATEDVESEVIVQELPKQVEFSGNEFRLLFDNIQLPNLTKVNTPPPITGNDIADTRIRQIAESRGYRLRSSPVETVTKTDGFPMQLDVQAPWLALKEKAQSEGLSMSVTSAYRSVDDQRVLFLNRLQAEGVTITKVANGLADDAVTKVLKTTAIPGYSKHHTGYTLDFVCADYAFDNFKNSPCHQWLIKNNFEQAKNYGFIPSYPIDADLQGPDPEAWEYVYVGKDILYQ